MADVSQCLTVTQVTRVLGVSKTRVWQLIEDGTLEVALRRNRNTLIGADAIGDYAETIERKGKDFVAQADAIRAALQAEVEAA